MHLCGLYASPLFLTAETCVRDQRHIQPSVCTSVSEGTRLHTESEGCRSCVRRLAVAAAAMLEDQTLRRLILDSQLTCLCRFANPLLRTLHHHTSITSIHDGRS